MTKNTLKLLFIALAVLMTIGFGTMAFGHGSRGGWGMGYHGGSGMHHRGYDGQGYSDTDHHRGWRGTRGHGYRGNLSEEDLEKLDRERDAFLEATEGLREKVYAKETELRKVLATDDPDAKAAAKLQKEISELRAELDQMHVGHLIAVRKISPELGKRFRGRGTMGYGPYAGKPCWE